MRSRTKITKDANGTPAPAQVFRLTDMVVEEVSAVDRAANKRTFLLVKSASGAAPVDGEVVAGENGELTVTKAPGDETPPAPAAALAPAEPAAEPAATPVLMRMSPEYKAELVKRFDDAIATLTKLRESTSASEEVQGLTEIPQEIMDGVGGLVTVLTSGVGVAKADITKGKKQFSAARVSTLRTAGEAINALLAEIDAVAAETEPEAQLEATPATPAPAPVAASKADATRVAKTDTLLAQIVSIVEKQTVAIKKQGEKLEAVERARGVSNAGVVEDRVETKKNESETIWPRDMSASIRNAADADEKIDFTSR